MRTTQKNDTVNFLHRSKLHYSIQHLIIDLVYESKITVNNNIQTACNKQQQIGWDHFLRGRLSKKWVHQQNLLTNRRDGNKVWTNVIRHIFHSLHEIWLDRNRQLHSKGPNSN